MIPGYVPEGFPYFVEGRDNSVRKGIVYWFLCNPLGCFNRAIVFNNHPSSAS